MVTDIFSVFGKGIEAALRRFALRGDLPGALLARYRIAFGDD